MRKRSGLVAALVGLSLWLVAVPALADSASQLMPNDPGAGKTYYSQVCAACHGANAMGGTMKMGGKVPPNLSWVANRFDDFMGLAERIADTMPYGSTTDPQDARNVAAYLWTLDGRTPPPAGVSDMSWSSYQKTGQVVVPTPVPPQPAPTAFTNVQTPSAGTSNQPNGAPSGSRGTATAPGTSRSASGSGGNEAASQYLVATVPTAQTGLNLGEQWDLGLVSLGLSLLLLGFSWLRAHGGWPKDH